LPLKIIRGDHWEIVGRGSVLLSSPPALDQAGENYTGRIVEEAALLSKAHAVIEREWRRTADSSTLEPTLEEFQSSTQRFLDDFEIRCVLEILGNNEPGIEIRTVQVGSDYEELVQILKERLARNFDLKIDPADSEAKENSHGKTPIIRLLLGPDERGFKKELVVSGIADAVILLNAKLGYLETDERASGVLD
jgi:hypothetical protein